MRTKSLAPMPGADWFIKSHALGNDYIVLDPAALTFPLTARTVRLICDRHMGVGSDGILALWPSTRAPFGLRIFNPDGSEAEKSGNGVRIFSRFLFDHGLATTPTFSIDTPGGLVGVRLHLEDGRVGRITVDMGTATFRSEQIPVAGPPREVVNEELIVDGHRTRITAVSVGNPHCVIFVERLNAVDLHTLGPRLEHHAIFPNRTNVQLAKVENAHRIAALIWERGAGETLASGSSACAIVAAAVRNKLADRTVTVSMPGGELLITVAPDWSIQMTGPAEEVYSGTFSEGFVRKLRAISETQNPR